MKIKTTYLYILIIAAAVAIFVIFTPGNKTEKAAETEVAAENHGTPDRMNVTESAKHQLDMLKKLAENNPGDTLTVRKYADMLAAAHQPDKAKELYAGILEKDNKRIDIMLELTRLEYNSQNFDEAERYTKKILNIDPDQPESNYNLGAIYAARGEFDKAEKAWEKVVKNLPGTRAAELAEDALKGLK